MALDDDGCEIFELNGFQKFMQDHRALFVGIGANFLWLKAASWAFKIGDADKKLPGYALDGIWQFADDDIWYAIIFYYEPCGHFGPDPFIGHMQRDGRDNPVRRMGARQMVFKVFYAVCTNSLKSQAVRLPTNGFLFIDDCYLMGGINFAEFLGRSKAKFTAADDPKFVHD